MDHKLSQIEYLNNATFKKSLEDFFGNYYRMYLIENQNSDSTLQNFILLLEWGGQSNESVDIDKLYTEEEYTKTRTKIQPVVEKIINGLVAENCEKDAFYRQLLSKLFDDILFSNELERICSMVALFMHPKIPYYQLGQALKMDNDKYQQITNSIKESVSKAYFALQYGYAQKTEVASQLYNVVKELEGDENRIVLIANIIGYYNSRMKLLYDKLTSESNGD